ncbi:MAG TPA: hypothetical protein VH476_02510 [Solirubrobacterales bacterium]|jgi:hypothetical protein
MRRAARLGATWALASALLAAAVPAVSGETTHVYPVKMTISVDRSEHKIKGTVESDAPSFFCEESTVRLYRVEPGKDKKVNFVKPVYGKWGMRTTSRLSGSKVYAEVSKYHLPDRPVVCLAARTRTVTAP